MIKLNLYKVIEGTWHELLFNTETEQTHWIPWVLECENCQQSKH